MSTPSLAPTRASSLRLHSVGALAVLVGGLALLPVLIVLRSPLRWIVLDELVYSDLAKSLGEGGLLRMALRFESRRCPRPLA